MNDITRYTYLNLLTRPDRRLLAACTGNRDRIPRHLIHFWEGEWFETYDALARHALNAGIDHFKSFIGNDNPVINTPVGQNYNVIRYLMDRVKRKDTLEVFMHDDVYFLPPFAGQVHRRLNSVCQILQEKQELNILLLDPLYFPDDQVNQHLDPDTVEDQPFVFKGIKGNCCWARVYSTKGAQFVLDRMLNLPPHVGIEDHSIVGKYASKRWVPPGAFTMSIPIVSRYAVTIVGSDCHPDKWK